MSGCEFLTPATQTFSFSPSSEHFLIAARVGALRGGSRGLDGRGPIGPGIGLTGARVHPEFAKGVGTGREAGQVFGRCELGAGRCRLGSEKDSLRVGEAGFCTCLGVGDAQFIGGGWSLGVRAVCLAAGGRGEGGRLKRSVLTCVLPLFMGVVSYGTSSHLGVLGPRGCGSMYKHVAQVIGSRGEISVEVP